MVEGCTNYVSMKRCLNCFHISEATNKRCTQCNHVFMLEATEGEKLAANERLVKMHEDKEAIEKIGKGEIDDE